SPVPTRRQTPPSELSRAAISRCFGPDGSTRPLGRPPHTPQEINNTEYGEPAIDRKLDPRGLAACRVPIEQGGCQTWPPSRPPRGTAQKCHQPAEAQGERGRKQHPRREPQCRGPRQARGRIRRSTQGADRRKRQDCRGEK